MLNAVIFVTVLVAALVKYSKERRKSINTVIIPDTVNQQGAVQYLVLNCWETVKSSPLHCKDQHTDLVRKGTNIVHSFTKRCHTFTRQQLWSDCGDFRLPLTQLGRGYGSYDACTIKCTHYVPV